jgi:hypothetical protein
MGRIELKSETLFHLVEAVCPLPHDGQELALIDDAWGVGFRA